MTYVYGALALLIVGAGLVSLFVRTPAVSIASWLRFTLLVAAVGLGGLLAATGRFGFGLMLIVFAAGYYLRTRPPGKIGATGPGQGRFSTVRSAMFEMRLDHDSGELDGVVLTGPDYGRRLSQMPDAELLALHAGSADEESRQLLEAYLDRRLAAWREHAQANQGAGTGGATRAGAMTKQEAYEVLGLAPGAGAQQVREAHRRLMKRVHPDRGGSNFLAARINEAKGVLLD
jgi:hypothetical protein